MCLTVKQVFNPPIPAMECIKYISKTPSAHRGNKYTTVVTGASIEDNGILMPLILSKRKLVVREEVDRGFIHAFKTRHKRPNWLALVMPFKKVKAIALNVRAIGEDGDLICEKLYIPSLDKTRKIVEKKRVKRR